MRGDSSLTRGSYPRQAGFLATLAVWLSGITLSRPPPGFYLLSHTLGTFRPSWPGPTAHGHTSRACTGEKHEGAEEAPTSPAPSAVSHLPGGYSGALEILGHLPRGSEETQSPSDVRASISASSALSCFSCLQLFATLWTADRQLLCPWDSPGKNTGGVCHFLLQGIFLTQGSNPRLCLLYLLHWKADSLPLDPRAAHFSLSWI